MKSTNIHNLRVSVTKEFWSTSKGASQVLHKAWEDKKPGEKIIFLFSVIHKYVGYIFQEEVDPH